MYDLNSLKFIFKFNRPFTTINACVMVIITSSVDLQPVHYLFSWKTFGDVKTTITNALLHCRPHN